MTILVRSPPRRRRNGCASSYAGRHLVTTDDAVRAAHHLSSRALTLVFGLLPSYFVQLFPTSAPRRSRSLSLSLSLSFCACPLKTHIMHGQESDTYGTRVFGASTCLAVCQRAPPGGVFFFFSNLPPSFRSILLEQGTLSRSTRGGGGLARVWRLCAARFILKETGGVE